MISPPIAACTPSPLTRSTSMLSDSGSSASSLPIDIRSPPSPSSPLATPPPPPPPPSTSLVSASTSSSSADSMRDLQPPSPTHKRVRSGTTWGSPTLPPHLTGSYELSLLSSRVRAGSFPFTCSIGALAATDLSPDKKKRKSESTGKRWCPRHLNVAFEAGYVDLTGNAGRSSVAPYVGEIDLEGHLMRQALEEEASCQDAGTWDGIRESNRSFKRAEAKFPGYRVPPVGQLQIILKNAESTAIKVFIVPYNLSPLVSEDSSHPEDSEGRKCVVRQKGYLVELATGKHRFACAVQLQFCSPPLSSSCTRSIDPSTKRSKTRKCRRLYLYGKIRVVFTPLAPELGQRIQSVIDIPSGGFPTMKPANEAEESTDEKTKTTWWTPYYGPAQAWINARKERARKASSALQSITCGQQGHVEVPPSPLGNGERRRGSIRHSEIESSPISQECLGDAFGALQKRAHTSATNVNTHPLSLLSQIQACEDHCGGTDDEAGESDERHDRDSQRVKWEWDGRGIR